jgi:hypothetical protein
MGVATHGAKEAPLEGVPRSIEGDRAAEYPVGIKGKPSAPDSEVRGREEGGRTEEAKDDGEKVGLGMRCPRDGAGWATETSKPNNHVHSREYKVVGASHRESHRGGPRVRTPVGEHLVVPTERTSTKICCRSREMQRARSPSMIYPNGLRC